MDSMSTIKIDTNDRRIIALLKRDARISQEEIAKIIGLSRPTVQKRIKSLEDQGIILKYTIIADEKKLGKEITAFLLVQVDRTTYAWASTYNEILLRMDELEILESHHITGSEDVILKMKTRNIDTLEANLIRITQMKGVSRTRTLICLSSIEGEYEISISNTQKRPVPKDILWNYT